MPKIQSFKHPSLEPRALVHMGRHGAKSPMRVYSLNFHYLLVFPFYRLKHRGSENDLPKVIHPIGGRAWIITARSPSPETLVSNRLWWVRIWGGWKGGAWAGNGIKLLKEEEGCRNKNTWAWKLTFAQNQSAFDRIQQTSPFAQPRREAGS